MSGSTEVGAPRPVPVIIASHPLAGFWPRSTPERPWCFRRSGKAQSPVERLLEQFLEDPRFSPPVLVVGELAVRAATEQTASWRERGVHVLAVPADTRNGTAAVLAALEIAARKRRALVAYLPASLDMDDGLSPVDALARGTAMLPRNRMAMIYTRRARPSDRGTGYVTGSFLGGSLHEARSVLPPSAAESRELAMAANDLHIPTGPVVCRLDTLIEMVQHVAPMLFKSAISALQHADRTGMIIRPHPGFLSLVAGFGVGDIMASQRSGVVLNTLGEHMRTLRGWADIDPAEESGAAPIRIGVAGLPQHRIIQGSAGIFICATGEESQASRFYPSPGSSDFARSPGSHLRNWGTEQLVEEEYGIRILRLEVSPGMVLPPECHFRRRETWSVSSGNAIATVDNRVESMVAGDHLTIPQGAIHTLRNVGSEPLVLYECRIGAYLEDDDRIRTTSLSRMAEV